MGEGVLTKGIRYTRVFPINILPANPAYILLAGSRRLIF